MPIIFLLFYKPPTIFFHYFQNFFLNLDRKMERDWPWERGFIVVLFCFCYIFFSFDTHLFNKMQRTASLKLRVVFVANKISRYISLTCKNVGSYMWVLNVFQNLVEQYVCAPLDQPLRLKVSDITTLWDNLVPLSNCLFIFSAISSIGDCITAVESIFVSFSSYSPP